MRIINLRDEFDSGEFPRAVGKELLRPAFERLEGLRRPLLLPHNRAVEPPVFQKNSVGPNALVLEVGHELGQGPGPGQRGRPPADGQQLVVEHGVAGSLLEFGQQVVRRGGAADEAGRGLRPAREDDRVDSADVALVGLLPLLDAELVVALQRHATESPH
jgi:hypothetical protein